MSELTRCYADIQTILEQARSMARSAVNSAMVEANWLIGQRIVREEQQGHGRAVHGERLLANLSQTLRQVWVKDFPMPTCATWNATSDGVLCNLRIFRGPHHDPFAGNSHRP